MFSPTETLNHGFRTWKKESVRGLRFHDKIRRSRLTGQNLISSHAFCPPLQQQQPRILDPQRMRILELQLGRILDL
jgi:hypothetical protein